MGIFSTHICQRASWVSLRSEESIGLLSVFIRRSYAELFPVICVAPQREQTIVIMTARQESSDFSGEKLKLRQLSV